MSAGERAQAGPRAVRGKGWRIAARLRVIIAAPLVAVLGFAGLALANTTGQLEQARRLGGLVELDARRTGTTVSTLAAHYSTAPLFVSVGANARELNGAVVSANYFPLFGMQPALGRFFTSPSSPNSAIMRNRISLLGYNGG